MKGGPLQKYFKNNKRDYFQIERQEQNLMKKTITQIT